MPFDHDRRERSANQGASELTPAAFGTFWLLQKVLAATRQCVLRKEAFLGGETKTLSFTQNTKPVTTETNKTINKPSSTTSK
jgi:hypothetical protein